MRHVAPRRSGPPVLVLLGTLLAAVLTGVAALLASGLGEPEPSATGAPILAEPPAERPAEQPSTDDSTPEEVLMLRAWDRARADAWATADDEALASLYVTGSSAGRRDVAALRTYADRGLRVEGLRTQVLSADLRRSTERRRVMWVTDRVVDGEVVTASGEATPLPDDTATRRELVWRRTGGAWLLARVREV